MPQSNYCLNFRSVLDIVEARSATFWARYKLNKQEESGRGKGSLAKNCKDLGGRKLREMYTIADQVALQIRLKCILSDLKESAKQPEWKTRVDRFCLRVDPSFST